MTGVGPALYADFWVIEAYSANREQIPDVVLDRLLGSQTSDGWWPIHARQIPRNVEAPFYITALMTIALANQLPFVALPEKKQAVQKAIQRAQTWIISTAPDEPERWADYPNNGRKNRSALFGGMAITALTGAPHTERQTRIAMEWARKIRVSPASLFIGSDVHVRISPDVTFFTDVHRYIPFAWEICGAAAAWPMLGMREKAALLFAVEESLQKEVSRPDPFGRTWVADDAAFCLRRLGAAARMEVR